MLPAGTLAGSTILLLSLAWGFSVILGRCDINERGLAQDKTLTRRWDLTGTGVTVDKDVGQGAAIMAASVLLYGIVQVGWVLPRIRDMLNPEGKMCGCRVGAGCIGCLRMCRALRMLQVPAFLGASDSPQAALAGAVICLSACVGYCIYSVLFPGLQKRRIDAARRKVGVKVLCSALIFLYCLPLSLCYTLLHSCTTTLLPLS